MSARKFWETMNLLIGKEYRKTGKEVMQDVEDWVDKVIVKKELSTEESEKEVTPHNKERPTNRLSHKVDEEKEIEEFLKSIDLPKVDCKFSHPHVTSRLEKLMGSNLVSLTDRDYMQRLQERILEDYAESMEKRIKIRENEEMERVKNLVLSGRIPLNEAPESMADHPIMTIEKHCRKLIAQRRAKIKIPKVHIPTHLYYDDTPDPPSGLSIENGHVFRKSNERLCNPYSRFLPPDQHPFAIQDEEYVEEEEEEEERIEGEQEETENDANVETLATDVGEEVEEEEVVEEFMFSHAEYNKLKYESPLIKRLRMCQTVEELYALADEIIGAMHALDVDEMPSRATSNDTLLSIAASIAPSEDHKGDTSEAGSTTESVDV